MVSPLTPHITLYHNRTCLTKNSPPFDRSDFEDLFSVQGNLFMSLVQGYAATKPVMPR